MGVNRDKKFNKSAHFVITMFLCVAMGIALLSCGQTSGSGSSDIDLNPTEVVITGIVELDNLDSISNDIELSTMPMNDVNFANLVTRNVGASFSEAGVFQSTGLYYVGLKLKQNESTFLMATSNIEVTRGQNKIDLGDVLLKETGSLDMNFVFTEPLGENGYWDFYSNLLYMVNLTSSLTFGSATQNITFEVGGGSHDFKLYIYHKNQGEPTVNYEPLVFTDVVVEAGVTNNLGTFTLTPAP